MDNNHMNEIVHEALGNHNYTWVSYDQWDHELMAHNYIEDPKYWGPLLVRILTEHKCSIYVDQDGCFNINVKHEEILQGGVQDHDFPTCVCRAFLALEEIKKIAQLEEKVR